MLRANKKQRNKAQNSRFVIVASKYNARYVDSMLHAAKAELDRAGAQEVQIVRVPGAFEIPVVAAQLAREKKVNEDAVLCIICLGVILRGETVHAAHIGEAVTRALMQIQLESGVPVVHEVLLLENVAQAEARCMNPKHNRGTEAAQTALEIATLMRTLGRAAMSSSPR